MSEENTRPDIDYEEALADVDFPHPRAECVESVAAAHRVLHDHNRATKSEFIDALEPSKNHRIGLTGAQMAKIGETHGYEKWWWDRIIKPGLRRLPDVDAPKEELGYWEISSASDMADSADESSLESYVKGLKIEVWENPNEIDLSDLEPILTDPRVSPDIQIDGVKILKRAAKVRDDVGAPFVNELIRLLDRPSLNDITPVVKCLYELSKNDPQAVMPAAEALIDQTTTEPSTDTKYALNCCSKLIQVDSIPFVKIAPKAGVLVASDDRKCRQHAVYLLQKIAEHDPEDVIPFIDEIATDIDERSVNYQTNALIALGKVAPHTEDVTPIVEAAETLMDDSNTKVKANAVGVLADVSTEYPIEVMDIRSKIVELLNEEDDHIRINATSVLLNIAIEEQDACPDTLQALINALDDRHPAVRRNACKALGHIGSMEAYDGLQARSVSDQDYGVRKVADWAINQLM